MGDFAADAPQADDTQDLIPKFESQETGALPAAGLDRLVCLRDVARQRQHHRHRVLGGGDRVAGGCIDDQHAGTGSGLDIDVVHASAGSPDDLEAGARLNDAGIDPRLAPHDEGVVLGNAGDQRGGALLQLNVNLGMLAQPSDPRLRDRIGDEDARHRAQATRLGSEDCRARRAAVSAAPRVTRCPCASRPRSSASTVATTSGSYTAPR